MNFKDLEYTIGHYKYFLSSVLEFIKFIRNSSNDLYLRQILLIQTVELFKRLSNTSESFTKTNEDSLSIYQLYDDREQRDYETGSPEKVLFNGSLVFMSPRESRSHYLSNLYPHLDEVIIKKGRIKILEVGCGNCINIVEILERYSGKVELYGIDISGHRISVAQKYFGERLSAAHLEVASITEQTDFDDKSFDVVFSMHCIEQIAYETKRAVGEMYRLTGEKLVMIEPVFENGSVLQKLYLLNSDHGRILLKTCIEMGLTPRINKVINIQSNPANQSSLLVFDRR